MGPPTKALLLEMLLYIDQPTLGVLNFGFIKYVCISEPELYLRNALYTFPASGNKNISKKNDQNITDESNVRNLCLWMI